MEELVGRTLGGYEIRELIGSGGMATVYKGYQTNMERLVAVKVLPHTLALDPTFRGRFEQEAKTIARLEHARILPVYDYGHEDNLAFLVMRYLPGGTLSDVLRKDPPDLPETARIIKQVAEGLDYAHQRGVIHRDVKPSNVMLDSTGDVYLTDFGIAKLLAGDAQFTGSGIVGTPAYLAPEQGLGNPVDPRTDIYSLGVVLYQMVTGSVPYEASTPMAVVVKHINEQLPSPRSINPDLPVAVEAVILRAMAKNADERYQTCGDLAADLQRAVSGQQVAAALPPPVTHQPAKTAALAEDLPAQTAVLPPEADLEDDASGEEPKKRRRLLPILGGVVLGCVLLLCVGTVLSGLFGADEPEPIANATATANPDGAVDTQPTAEPDANPDDNPGSGDQDNPPPPPPSGNLTCPPDQRVIATDLRGFDVLESTTNINTEVDDEGSLLMLADDEEAFYVFPILARSFSIEVALGYPPDTDGDFVLVTRLDTGLETGYSLVVSPAEQGLLLLRDSELVGEAYGVPLPNPDEGPLRLTMRFMDDRIDAGVNGNMVLSFVDPEPLQAGRIALGAFDGEFRVQRVQMCSQDGARILFEEPFVDPDLPLWEAIGFEEAEGEVADGELYVELVPGTGIEQEGVVGFPSLEAPAIVVEAAALPQPPFSVVTTVDIQPEENFQGAGLIVLNEAEAPLLTLIRGYCDEGENCEGDAIYMEAWTLAGQRTIGRITEGGGDLPDGPVMLRLMFEEDLIIGEYSTNGGMRWIAVGAVPYVVEQRAAFFGLFTTTGFAEDVEPLPAIFEHFLVLVNN